MNLHFYIHHHVWRRTIWIRFKFKINHYLLNNYGDNNKVTHLIDEIDIWINPLQSRRNSYGGNQNVWSFIRYNSNFIDLNRNYPDPEDGHIQMVIHINKKLTFF